VRKKREKEGERGKEEGGKPANRIPSQKGKKEKKSTSGLLAFSIKKRKEKRKRRGKRRVEIRNTTPSLSHSLKGRGEKKEKKKSFYFSPQEGKKRREA